MHHEKIIKKFKLLFFFQTRVPSNCKLHYNVIYTLCVKQIRLFFFFFFFTTLKNNRGCYFDKKNKKGNRNNVSSVGIVLEVRTR